MSWGHSPTKKDKKTLVFQTQNDIYPIWPSSLAPCNGQCQFCGKEIKGDKAIHVQQSGKGAILQLARQTK